jgi:maltooligosyltrehalose trehalohydrolase
MRRVHSMPFGAEIARDGVRFALWAPTARDVGLVLDGTERPMAEAGGGWRRMVVTEAQAGSRYAFRIDGELQVPDPASRFQPDDVHGPSLVVDPSAYEWTDGGWHGRPWEEAVLYELHVGTATPEGTYAALGEKLEEFRDLGITAIELMPLSDFLGSRNWGYDGVLPYAPDASYGSAEDLKRLVDRAHALGLMVFLDVVYNHFGPAGNYLHAYAKTFFTERHKTPWGAGINVDGAEARVVRDFFVHNALYWLEEYHFDGLRFDAVHAILDDSETHLVAELAARIRRALPGREVHLVLENEANAARWLARDARKCPTLHTAQWADDIHNSWHALLTGEREGYYEDFADKPVERLGRALAEGFAYQGEPSSHKGGAPRGEPSAHLPPTAFVAFLQNHDQTGNRAYGDRLTTLADPAALKAAVALLLLMPQIPMIFMGEEIGSRAPFLYFTDHGPELAKAVREGRRREFAAFADVTHGREIPDPNSPSSFQASKPEQDAPEADAWRALYHDLLALRHNRIVPHLHGARALNAQPIGDAAVVAHWRLGNGEKLTLACNLGTQPVSTVLPASMPLWGTGSDCVAPNTMLAWIEHG